MSTRWEIYFSSILLAFDIMAFGIMEHLKHVVVQSLDLLDSLRPHGL